jgi:hypothetical protein
VRIRGTFSAHSVRVKVDAREPPSQLQEGRKESTKVDAEYNLPTWVPKTRVNKTKRRIPGVELRVHRVLPRGQHNTSIKIIINWSCAKNRHEVRLIPAGNIRGTCREH